MKIYNWLEMWLKTYKRGTVKVNTYKNYEYAINLTKNYVEDKNIDEINEVDITELYTYILVEGYSKSTIRIIKITLTQAFKKAMKHGYINYNPVEDIKIPIDAHEKIVEALTIEEQKKIESAALNDKLGKVIIFLLETGLRKEELINLKWQDYNAKEKSIVVKKSKTKNGIREIPLSGKAWLIITRQSKINEYIFNNTKNRPLSNSSMKCLFKRIQNESGVLNFTPHVCRHSFVTRLIEKDAEIKTVSELAGHSNVAFTLHHYVTSSIEQKRKVIKLLNVN